jgi:hypothetical protein
VECGTLAAALIFTKAFFCGGKCHKDSGSKRAALHIKDRSSKHWGTACFFERRTLKILVAMGKRRFRIRAFSFPPLGSKSL